MSVSSRRAASFLATAWLCLMALSSQSLAGDHGGGAGAQISGRTSTGAGMDHSGNGATSNNATTAMPAQTAAAMAKAQPAAGKKVTIQRLIQADRAVHMRNMN